MHDMLVRAGVQVHTFNDDPSPTTPDAVFPNNWVSFHADGTRILYPMLAVNRRKEVRIDWIEQLQDQIGVKWEHTVDLRPLGEAGHFLEGTGSLILDRRLRVAYAALSPRTTREGLAAFASATGYEVVAMQAESGGHPIYHTNVMMCLGREHAMVCLDTIPIDHERRDLLTRLDRSGFEVIEIDPTQMAQFAGNQITLADAEGNPQIVMSQRALASLTPAQVKRLERHGNIWAPCLDTIELYGGGSARCMVAEVAPPIAAPGA
jgi:hypothetical protein